MSELINVPDCIGRHDILFMTLDTLRYDVAEAARREGHTPNFARLLGDDGWEERHSPASFTYAAHHAFFSGFLPTPIAPISVQPKKHQRLFAARFPGSETSGTGTLVVDAPDIVTGLGDLNYRTICVGGTGFFNMQSPLGRVFPAMFQESYWAPSLGVADRQSARNQIDCAQRAIEKHPADQRLFVFLNMSACHPPHAMYLTGATEDSPHSQKMALADIDSQLPRLLESLTNRAPLLVVICSDHGTAFGEDGYYGHRIGHPSVWTVPYAHTILPQTEAPI